LRRRLTGEFVLLRQLKPIAFLVLGLSWLLGLAVGQVITAGEGTAAPKTRPAQVGTEAPIDLAQSQNLPRTKRNKRAGSPSTDETPKAGSLPARVRDALAAGVEKANALGGTAEAAVWVPGWDAPVTVGDADTPHRMWSMSKAVTAVALHQAAGGGLSARANEAVTDAITRSDNCAQRSVIVSLQELAGGTEGALSAFDDVLAQSGAHLRTAPSTGTIADQPECRTYVAAHAPQATGRALQLGTAEWNLIDAIAFAHGLATGTYEAPGDTLLDLMRRPKLRPLTSTPEDMTAPPNWGAGAALANFNTAYKGGWGGSQQGRYMAGQIVVADIRGQRVAFVAIYHPKAQPPTDDPGKTRAPEALQTMFAAGASALE
jgi:hypothetical protein